ncbi:MAG: NAD-dependent deacetylase [Candidatus Accumulibacter sp.]|jgi:NAD-dependent SIR2 family protein deacetylase|nr:NAD-dependent deacetylase [Accumulibacter sp.]
MSGTETPAPFDVALIARSAEWIAQSSGLLIAAGAGMGVDSGLADFRGTEGFWRAYPPLRQAGLRFEEIANPRTFDDDPGLAWGFYGHRLRTYRETRPHRGFAILRALAGRLADGAFVVTSNVDGHFQKAGFAPDALCEVHGSIHHLQCLEPCSPRIWTADAFAPEVDAANCRLVSLVSPPPSCPHCGEIARPNILMFGDGGWLAQRAEEQEKRFMAWRERAARPVIIELGAGKAVATIRRMSERMKLPLIRINPRDPEVPAGQIGIKAGALATLEAIQTALAKTGFLPERAGQAER